MCGNFRCLLLTLANLGEKKKKPKNLHNPLGALITTCRISRYLKIHTHTLNTHEPSHCRPLLSPPLEGGLAFVFIMSSLYCSLKLEYEDLPPPLFSRNANRLGKLELVYFQCDQLAGFLFVNICLGKGSCLDARGIQERRLSPFGDE